MKQQLCCPVFPGWGLAHGCGVTYRKDISQLREMRVRK